MSLNRMRMHSREELETWVATIEDAREELEALMKRELDMSAASLDAIEKFLLARYKNADAALKIDQRGVIDAAARVVGVALLLRVPGARWDIVLDDEKNVHYRLPILKLPNGEEESPLYIVTAALERRTGSYVRDLLQCYEEDFAPKKTKKAPARQPKKKKAAARAVGRKQPR